MPDLVARPLSTLALSDLLDRKPHLLRPIAAQLLPLPAAIDPVERLGIDLARQLPTVIHCRIWCADCAERSPRGPPQIVC